MAGAEEAAETIPTAAEGVAEPRFWQGVREIYSVMSPTRRRQFYLVLGLMLVGAVSELATIGAVVPFLSLLQDPSALERFGAISSAFHAIGVRTAQDRLTAAALIFAAVVCVAGAVRFELSRSLQNFGFSFAHELILEVQRRFLLQPYDFHILRNTSTLISALDKTEVLVFEVLIPLMQAFIAAFTGLFIIVALIAIDPVTAAIAAAFFSAVYFGVSAVTRARLARNSEAIARGFDERLKIVQESLGGIRDVIIDGSQDLYLEQFDRENSKLSRARANTAIIAAAPRFLIETIGILAIAAIALFAAREGGGFASALPALGAIALGAQRLLPLVQQTYNGWSTASGYLSVLSQTTELLKLPLPSGLPSEASVEPLPLRRTISIDGLSFTYRGRRRPAIDGVTFEIPAGSAVAVVGETGSGKSTLADLLMGLLEPDEGRILIDGLPLTSETRRRWQRSIAHVPQAIFLADTSIARNIALAAGDEELDMPRVIEAARQAQLHDFVESLADGYDTVVGERGVRLSGGQRQRLGLARAIYKHSDVLVLDEATSALDEVTEAGVIAALEQLRDAGRTIILIAHRRSTIACADLVIALQRGRVRSIAPLADALETSGRPRRQSNRS